MTVSYTHLDVYKRQESYTPYTASDAAIVDFLPEGWGLKAQDDDGNVWSNTGTQIKSVKLAETYSISEGDVYKRQFLRGAFPLPFL